MVTAATKLNDTLWKESYDKPRQHIKKQRHYFANKGPSSQSYGFSSSNVRMWELDHKEDWAPKNWCFRIVVLENTHESLLDSKEIKPVKSILKEISPEYSLEGLMLKLKLSLILWLPHAKKLTLQKRLWCWEKLKVREEGSRGWDG